MGGNRHPLQQWTGFHTGRYEMQTALSLKLYLIVSGTIFFMVGVLHLFRLLNHWQMVVGTYTVPHVLSFVGCPVATAYAVWALLLLRRK